MKDDRFYLQFILQVIGRIEKIVSVGEKQFLNSELHQDAVLRNLHTMTETTQRLSDSLKDGYATIEWTTLSAFRNVIVHDYLGIDIKLIWRTISNDIPQFKRQIEEILKELDS